MATQEEIAKVLGLSRSTVKAALAERPKISLSEQTIAKVKRVAARMGYRPNRIAQAMRTGRSGMVGMIHFGGVDSVTSKNSLAVIGAIQDAGYECVATEVMWSPQRLETAVSTMLDAQVEGVVLVNPEEWTAREQIKRLREAGVPVVVVAVAGIRLTGVPCVRVDVAKGIRDLTRHLLGRGYKRIGLLSNYPAETQDPNVNWAGLEREAGFREAIVKAGGAVTVRALKGERGKPAKSKGPVGEVLSLKVKENWSNPYFGGYERMRALLIQGDLPEALVCANDDWVQGALTACAQEGVRVPEDLAMTGFDNAAYGGYGSVPITTATAPTQEMARRAVEMLKLLLKGKKLKSEEQLVKLGCEVVVRKSCGAGR
jgi:DNA-binding LacI/PurR family transcriptional regulator